MENKNFIFDITNIDIDLSLDKSERVKNILEKFESASYSQKIKVNGTVIYMNFLSTEKLNSKSILKVLN